ncbi:four helix bundle protein [Thiohalomonas denitrificans]|uniref:Four helix bundle protein n=1 Tax=Thiohalomonas denitrificans TaxID=415747 RepID=A0A1G5QI33_9GAMM|nr:four helix bundle protein [Thiohalomonas denitrificans]SCZ61352.1 four helix bundle protein [Thiohalomonas denitrificans]
MDALKRLEVWKRGCRLSVDVYKALRACPEWGFRNQISSSALSIPSNIAEGYERESAKERLQFLKIAKGVVRRTLDPVMDWNGSRFSGAIHRP